MLLGVGDDAALLQVPPGRVLVAAVDTLVEGRHFLPGAPPESVGHQALAVNLSDLAAMGAEPAWALLSLSLPVADEAWLARFSAGLYALAERHGVALVGGDTVRGPLVVTITALGFVAPRMALRRGGARPGDVLYVSGWPGEAAAGLEQLRRARRDRRRGSAGASLPLRRAAPGARPSAGRPGLAPRMDVSDGLLGDLQKLLCGQRRRLRGSISSACRSRPSSRDARRAPDCERLVLFGGDDYELLFTVPPDRAASVEAELAPRGRDRRASHRRASRPAPGVRWCATADAETLHGGGYDHFA